MATIQQTSIPQPVKIKNFYGLNLTGETQIQLGESPNMDNAYITENYDLNKFEGYKQIMATVFDTKSIQGMWYGKLGANYHFLFACNGHVYKITNGYWDDETDWDNGAFSTHTTDLGTLTDAPTLFFGFAGNVYIMNGTEYKYWTGTSTIADVAGYVPKVQISTTPLSGAGTAFEGINLLTGKKRMTFNGDGTAVFKLLEATIGSVDAVYVSGTLKTVTTHYTVDLTAGTVTFTAGNFPATGSDNVEIYWTKGTGSRDLVLKHKGFETYGIANDTRVFIYGNSNEQNRFRYSELADGIPSVEYFPAANYKDVGELNTPINDIIKQQSRLLISKEENSFYSYYDSVDLSGVTTVDFPVFTLNDTVGQKSFGQGQVIDNKPVTIDDGIQWWNTTNVKDERNVDNISDKIWRDLKSLDLTKCITTDFETRSEMWITIDKTLYIWHYGLYDTKNQKRVFSRIKLADEPTCYININGDLYFGTTTGLIMKFSEDFVTFNGTTINEYWESGFIDFGAMNLKKTLNKVWVSLQPQTKVSATFNYITDKEVGSNPQTISYQNALLELGVTTFVLPLWSFLVNFNPQPFRLKLKAKKFSYLKMVITNTSSTETCKILELDLQVEYGSESK